MVDIAIWAVIAGVDTDLHPGATQGSLAKREQDGKVGELVGHDLEFEAGAGGASDEGTRGFEEARESHLTFGFSGSRCSSSEG